jgi:hypothetical protein
VEAYGNRGVTYHRKGLGISDLDGLYSGKYDEEVRLYAFDILALDDLRKLPLSLRKQKLARLLKIRPICSTIPCYSARIGLAEEVGEVATARLPTVHPSDLNLMPDMRFW